MSNALGDVLWEIVGRLTISMLILILTVMLKLVGDIDSQVKLVVAGEERLALYNAVK